MNLPEPVATPPAVVLRRARRYRIAAVIIFLAGVVVAGVVYWIGSREKDYSDDPEMLGFNRAEQRQMGILYGKQGQLVDDFSNSLKQPGTQAVLVVIAAAVAALGCYQYSRMLEWEAAEKEQADAETKSP
jgi:hypothetical protein